VRLACELSSLRGIVALLPLHVELAGSNFVLYHGVVTQLPLPTSTHQTDDGYSRTRRKTLCPMSIVRPSLQSDASSAYRAYPSKAVLRISAPPIGIQFARCSADHVSDASFSSILRSFRAGVAYSYSEEGPVSSPARPFLSQLAARKLVHYDKTSLLGGFCGDLACQLSLFRRVLAGCFSECSHTRCTVDHHGCHMPLTRFGTLY
jgi:hypothetical protein